MHNLHSTAKSSKNRMQFTLHPALHCHLSQANFLLSLPPESKRLDQRVPRKLSLKMPVFRLNLVAILPNHHKKIKYNRSIKHRIRMMSHTYSHPFPGQVPNLRPFLLLYSTQKQKSMHHPACLRAPSRKAWIRIVVDLHNLSWGK